MSAILRDQFVFNVILLDEMREEIFKRWTQPVLDEPKLQRVLRATHRGHHDFEESFVQVTSGDGEDVNSFQAVFINLKMILFPLFTTE